MHANRHNSDPSGHFERLIFTIRFCSVKATYPLSGLYSSSTFRLVDVLQILAGQARYTGTNFVNKTVLQLTNFQHQYCAPRSPIGLARLICRFFSSISENGNVITARVTIDLFELCSERLGTIVRFFPEARANQANLLARDHFDNVKGFVQGKFRLSKQSYQLGFHQNGPEDTRRQSVAVEEAPLIFFYDGTWS